MLSCPDHPPFYLPRLLACAITLAGAAALAAPTASLSDELPPFEKSSPQSSLIRHAGTRAPISVVWRQVASLKDVLAVYPHPVVAGRVVVATTAGLQLSDDYGQSWQTLPKAASDQIGQISNILFPYDDPDLFYAASKSRGLWITRDAGKTFEQLASKSTGLASDSILAVEFNAQDRGRRTLLVAHGDAAPGLSRSLDGGKTWKVIFPDQHVHVVHTKSAQGIFIIAAPSSESDSMRLYLTPTLGEPWQEMARDIVCTGIASPVSRDDWVLVATADRGILRIARQGGVVRNIAPADVSEWASIGVTWGAHQDQQLIYAFEPTKLGLVLIDPASTTVIGEDAESVPRTKYYASSDGLLRTSVVREGAHIRAGVGGTRFYASINSLLYVGQRAQGPQPILQVDVSPPVRCYDGKAEQDAIAEVNAQLKTFLASPDASAGSTELLQLLSKKDALLGNRLLTVTARFDPSAAAPDSVTADLSRLGHSSRSRMESVGDGLYRLRFVVDPSRLNRQNDDWRRTWPGPVAFTVTAVSNSGGLSSAVASFAITDAASSRISILEALTMEKGKPVLVNDQPLGRKRRYMRGFATDPAGPWRVAMHRWGGEYDISSYYALALTIRSREPSSQELFIQLRDQPAYDYPHSTAPLPLLKSGLVSEGRFTGELQRVVIPLKQLMGDATEFQPNIFSALLLSGEGGKRVEFFVDQVLVYPTPESLGLEESE